MLGACDLISRNKGTLLVRLVRTKLWCAVLKIGPHCVHVSSAAVQCEFVSLKNVIIMEINAFQRNNV